MIKLPFDENKFIIPNEVDCINELKEFIVKNNLYLCDCGSTNYYWKKDKRVFECKSCKKRKTAKSFCKIMQNSNLKINLWLSVLHLYCLDFNPSKIQRILNHNKYSTIWEKVFLVEQAEKKYLKIRLNRQNNSHTNILPITNLSISKQVMLEQVMYSKKYISCDLYWRWFLQII